MARIRTIKPEFFNSFDIASVSPLARLFYTYLWTESDREGLLEWKPNNYKMRFFPTDNCDIHAIAKELIEQGLIEIIVDDICRIPAFTKHQVINNRESDSVLLSRVDDACKHVKAEGRKEGKGKEPASRHDEEIFNRFWDEYPKKVGKGDARKSWKKIKPSAELSERMIRAVKYQRSSEQWRKDGGQYIPNPATWLNQERWEDTLKPSASSQEPALWN